MRRGHRNAGGHDYEKFRVSRRPHFSVPQQKAGQHRNNDMDYIVPVEGVVQRIPAEISEGSGHRGDEITQQGYPDYLYSAYEIGIIYLAGGHIRGDHGHSP